MRILHIAPISLIHKDEEKHLKIGGLSKSVTSLALGQHLNDNQVGVVTTRESFNPFSVDIYWKSIGSLSVFALIKENPLQEIIKNFGKPDLIHAHDIYEIRQLIILLLAVSKGIKVYMSPRGTLSKVALNYKQIKKKAYLFLIFNFIASRIEAFVALNEGEKKSIMNFYPRKKIIIISNGVDEQTDFLEQNKYLYDQKINNQDINICFLGRFEIYIKGLDILLNSFLEYKNTNKNSKIRLTLIGAHSFKKLNSKEFINNIKLNLIDPSSLIVKDPLYNLEKLSALASADIFVHSSRTEGMPNGVLEAMSLQLPCLISPETNMGPIIENSKCGWVVNNNVKSYLEKFGEIESMTKESLALKGRNGQLYAKNYLTWKNVSNSEYS